MTLQIFSLHSSFLYNCISLKTKRCCDRGCTSNKKLTKQSTQKEYEDLYTGPKFNMHVRLAQILSTVLIVLTYSSSIPVLYFIAFLTFLIMYWVDKYLIFTYY